MMAFIIFYFSLWWIYFYNPLEFNEDMVLIKKLIIEKDYNQVISKSNLNPDQFYRFRLIMSLLSYIFFIIYKNSEMNIYNNIIGIILMIIVFKGLYLYELYNYNANLNRARKLFPYYLNNLSIYINKSPVVNAIFESIESAPELFKEDLYILVQDIHNGEKTGIAPYLDFYNKYKQIDDLHRVMVTLYNMNNNSSDNDIIMASLCKLSNEKLNEANNQKLDSNLDKQALMPWLGFLWLGFVIISLLLNFDLSMLGGIA